MALGRTHPFEGGRCVYGRQRRAYRDWMSALGEIEAAILRIGARKRLYDCLLWGQQAARGEVPRDVKEANLSLSVSLGSVPSGSRTLRLRLSPIS